MSHEFRTPVNSVIALARILLSRSDGDLTTEQEKQVTFIRKAAESLLELVNDLLDLAKVEAGKIVIRPVQFEIANLFGALRGMLRPLLVGDSVNLVFEEPDDLPPMFTDEAKVSQILRNFISNALKFTERGEVRVSSNLSQGRDAIVFSVSDTGIGIALEDQERIFQEFSQLDNPVQKRVRGTGLGLPLSKKFADLLGGHISVESRLGHGSTFSVEVPLLYRPSPTTALQAVWEVDPHRVPVLVVEDEPDALLICQKLMKGSNFQPLAARSLFEARQVLSQVQPRAIILDILLSGEDAWGFLAELKRDPRTAPISILVVTETDDEAKAVALGADAYRAKPLERKWLLDTLVALTGPAHSRQALIVDDDEVSRYLIRQAMLSLGLPIVEAESGIEGLRRARENRPAVILLDLIMPGLSGFEVLDQLKADTLTSDIPVIIVTASAMGPGQIHKLSGKTAGVVTKAELSGDALSALVIRATSISQPASHLA
jgi:CheY-like chemotaxis protein